MPTRNVNLTDHYDRLVEASVASGRYKNASEVVRAGLRLLERQAEEETAKIEWLRRAAEEGFAALDRGEGIEVAEDDLDGYIAGLGQRATRRLKDERDIA